MKDRLGLYIIISALLIVLDTLNLLAPFKNPVEVLAVNIKDHIYSAYIGVGNIKDLFYQYSNLKRIVEERDKLKQLNGELTLDMDILRNENSKLRDQLQAPLPASYQFIPANVIGLSRTMDLAIGANSGVKNGMTVVDGTILIGRIINAANIRSSIVLPTDSEIEIPVKTLRGAKGIVTGEQGNKIVLTQVLQKDPLFLEDQVVTTGDGGYPPNLLIGKITHITSDDVSVYKSAQIDPAVSYKTEKIVFIISNL